MPHVEQTADSTSADQLEILRTLATDAFSQIDRGLGIEVAGIAELKHLLDSIERTVDRPAPSSPAIPTANLR